MKNTMRAAQQVRKEINNDYLYMCLVASWGWSRERAELIRLVRRASFNNTKTKTNNKKKNAKCKHTTWKRKKAKWKLKINYIHSNHKIAN